MNNQVFSFIISIGQSLSRAITRSTRWKLSIPIPLDSALPMAKPIIQLLAKRKQGWPTGCAKKRAKWGNKEEAIRRNPSQFGSGARSRRIAGDLSPWRGERCRGVCMVVEHGSLTLEELHSTLFWTSPLLSKSLIDQTKPLFSPPISVFLSLSLVQVGRFFYRQYLHNSTIFRFSSHICSSSFGGFLLIDPYPVFLPNLSSLVWEVFHQQYDCLRLDSFLTGLECSHWSPGFPLQSPIIRLGGFLPDYHSRFPFQVFFKSSLSTDCTLSGCNVVTRDRLTGPRSLGLMRNNLSTVTLLNTR